jgi:Zinc finger C-x8-C-x5-C-x3-H type (and similar)
VFRQAQCGYFKLPKLHVCVCLVHCIEHPVEKEQSAHKNVMNRQAAKSREFGNSLCPYYARQGTCFRGGECWFSHDIARFAGTSFAESAPPCESWRKTGECSKGAACWYNHNQQLRNGGQPLPALPSASPRHSSSSSNSGMNSAARNVDDPPSLTEHSSEEMVAFLEQHASRTEVCARINDLSLHCCLAC